MNKIKYLFGLLLFTLFIPNVNALEYDIDTSVNNVSGSLYEVVVSLKNISDTDYGVGSCTLNIDLSGDVEFNGLVRTFSGWSMIDQDIYLFDTGSPALKDTDFILIPVKVSSTGTITISNISCSDGYVDKIVEDEIINLKYTPSSSTQNGGTQSNNNTQNNNKDNDSELDSNCDLSNILLSEGTIDFDPAVTEYEIDVTNIEGLMVEPETASSRATYMVTKNEDSVVIEVVALDGTSKKYTIYVNNSVDSSTNSEKENDYVPIFIGIICVLVLINIFRIVKNKKGL